jgi:hypothetical protein
MWLPPKSKVGNLPLLLGFSIQLVIAASLLRALHATKQARHLAYELHIPYARPLDVAASVGPPNAPLQWRAKGSTY